MVANKVAFQGGDIPKLTSAEQEVLFFLSKEFLTPMQVAIRRQTSHQAIYRIIGQLKKKGAMNSAYSPQEMIVEKSRPTCQPFINHSVRLHGQEFNINILFKDRRYKGILEKSNTIEVDGNTIRLYRDSIEIYSGKHFFGEDVQQATSRSFEYWQTFFRRLEHDLKVILVKQKHQNIRLVNHHYAEINNELAKDCNVKAEKIRVHTTDDGKLWFLIDNSFNLHEAETLHSGTAKQDMESVKTHFNDIRDNKPPTMTEVMFLMKQVVEINRETAAGLNTVVQAMKPKEQPEIKPEPLFAATYIG